MRIGLFAPYDLARSGGVGTHIRAQARALRARGHDVIVGGPASAPLADGEIRLGGTFTVTFSGTESGLGLDPRSLGRVRDMLDTHALDIAHVHEPLTPLVPWLVLLNATCPIVGTFHVHREHGHPWYPYARTVLAPLVRRLSCRIAVSEPARRTIAHWFPGTYEIVPNGIDADMFQTPRARPDDFARGQLHVLFVGRLEPRKGVDVLIRAMPIVQQRVPTARLVIVGDGPDRAALTSLARTIGVDVQFAGHVDDERLAACLQTSDVVCSPALGGESFGIVLLEAMACGKPIVASRIDGYAGLLETVDCAVMVPPKSVDALAGALASLLEDEPRRVALGARGPAAAQPYDWRAVAARLETIYLGLS